MIESLTSATVLIEAEIDLSNYLSLNRVIGMDSSMSKKELRLIAQTAAKNIVKEDDLNVIAQT